MIILSDRCEFVGAHLTKRAKDALKAEASRQGKSMSELIAIAVEEKLENLGAFGDKTPLVGELR